MVDNTEKRTEHRSEIRWPITLFTDHGPISGETTNIASRGMLISCEEPLHLKEVCHLTISPPDHEVIEVEGKAIWSDFYGISNEGTRYCIGMCLVKISDEDLEFLGEMVELARREHDKKAYSAGILDV